MRFSVTKGFSGPDAEEYISNSESGVYVHTDRLFTCFLLNTNSGGMSPI